MNLFRKGALSLCALLSLSFAMPQQASAEGFSTYLEGGARAMGLAGGLVARGGDPSVIAYNHYPMLPAGRFLCAYDNRLTGFEQVVYVLKA